MQVQRMGQAEVVHDVGECRNDLAWRTGRGDAHVTAGLELARQRRRQSIAIVATVFGPPPVWLPAFFLSCQRNADVSWIIVSSRRNKIAGPLTFSRNHELANSTYTIVPGVRRLSSDPAYCQLDERALTARPAERLEHEPPGGPRVYWNWKRHLTWSAEFISETRLGTAGSSGARGVRSMWKAKS